MDKKGTRTNNVQGDQDVWKDGKFVLVNAKHINDKVDQKKRGALVFDVRTKTFTYVSTKFIRYTGASESETLDDLVNNYKLKSEAIIIIADVDMICHKIRFPISMCNRK
jgi:hypothetical protein